MSTHAAECEAARREIYAAREAVRERELAKPLALIIDEYLGDRQRRTERGADLARQAWGAPPQGGLSRQAPRGGLRNTTFRR